LHKFTFANKAGKNKLFSQWNHLLHCPMKI
jgi:hypothetical protein